MSRKCPVVECDSPIDETADLPSVLLSESASVFATEKYSLNAVLTLTLYLIFSADYEATLRYSTKAMIESIIQRWCLMQRANTIVIVTHQRVLELDISSSSLSDPWIRVIKPRS